ncbi:MAG: transporter permease [Rhodocyclales bacterium]|nr:transporter permease [Rhodocyclales bacterium]
MSPAFILVVKLALRNVLRHRSRTMMTLTAIILGVTALILAGGFIEDTVVEVGESLIHSQSGHLQIARKGAFDFGARQPEAYLFDAQDLVRKMVAMPQVADVMRRTTLSALLNNGKTDLAVIVEGIEPEREARMGSYMTLASGRQLNDNDRDGALLGYGVARALNVNPGDVLTLVGNSAGGAINTIELRVIGVFHTFSNEYDARAVRIPISAAQDMLGTTDYHTIVVSLRRTADTNRVARALSKQVVAENLELRTWVQLNDFYESTVALYRQQFGTLILIVTGMVVLSVINTVNMSTMERIGEFGTMRATGDHGYHVIQLIVLECTMLALIGASIGALTGIGAANLINLTGIPMPPPPNADIGYTSFIRVTSTVVAKGWLVGFVATLLAAIIPCWRASRIPIVDALRRVA